MGPSSAVVYVDVLLLLAGLSFVMDYLLLWATSKVVKAPLRPPRLCLGALAGTVYFVAYYLAERGVDPGFAWLRSWPALVGVSFLMLILAFYPLARRALLRAGAVFYFIALSSGGAGVASGYALGWGITGKLAAAIAAILITAELGWGVVQKSLWQRLYHVTLEIVMFGEKVVTEALVDTGNQLKDPLGGAPVIVVEHGVVAHLFPEYLSEVLKEMEEGELGGISRLLAGRWSTRFRVIPYTALGKEKGLLVGFRPDEARLVIEGRRVPLGDVVVGLSPKPLDPEGFYRALLHPALLDAAAQSEREPLWARATSSSEGETPHASTPS